MCRVHQASKGANLVSNPGTPEVAETPHETYTNIVSERKQYVIYAICLINYQYFH